MTHHLADRNALAIALSISLGYDKAMKLLASILMITLLVTVAQPTAAQDANKKAEIQNMAILTAFLGVINKLMMAVHIYPKYIKILVCKLEN